MFQACGKSTFRIESQLLQINLMKSDNYLLFIELLLSHLCQCDIASIR